MSGMLAPGALREPPRLTVVVPCFNEQDVLGETAARLRQILDGLIAVSQIAHGSTILFVDDGSSDATWALIEGLAARQPGIHGLKLARNFGHQSAILAGLLASEAEATITIDADLQDPPETIGDMVASYRAGADVVCGVRNDRSSDTGFKRFTARAFYGLMRGIGVELVFDHADFRLMSRPAVESLRQFGETNLFLRGLIPQLGFRQEIVHYKRQPRFAGSSKYGLMRMLGLSLDGITSFSVFPLRLITYMGIMVSAVAFLAGLWALAAWILDEQRVPGWTSIVIPLYFLGGIQLISLGIIGEYLGKNYIESKRRPRYIVEKSV